MPWPLRVRPIALIFSLLLPYCALQLAWCDPAAASPPISERSRCDRSAFRVVVDVGHTLEVPGVRSARGVPEYEFNLRLAKLIEQRLLEAGFSRTALLIIADAPPRGLIERVARARKLRADLFLSIHHDGVPDRFLEKWEYEGQEHSFSDRFKGHSIFISNDNADRKGSLLYARLLGRQLKARGLAYTPHYTEPMMNGRRRILVDAEAGVYRYDQLIVLKENAIPAVLLEAGSIVNRDEELILAGEERQELISAAAVDAVERFCAVRSPKHHDRPARFRRLREVGAGHLQTRSR